MENIHIRVAEPADAAALLEIYAPYVRETAITFEYDVPTVDEFADRIRRTLEHYPYLVAVQGEVILGYAYAGVFKGRPAYDWAAETSIYIDRSLRRTGLGRKLYQALEELLKKQNILNVYACIAYPAEEDAYLTRDSVDFHSHMGYRLVGQFRQCGYKFDRWYDMVWMERMIGNHVSGQPPVKWFSELPDVSRRV